MHRLTKHTDKTHGRRRLTDKTGIHSTDEQRQKDRGGARNRRTENQIYRAASMSPSRIECMESLVRRITHHVCDVGKNFQLTINRRPTTVCLSVCLYACLSGCLYVCLSLFVCMYVCQSGSLSFSPLLVLPTPVRIIDHINALYIYAYIHIFFTDMIYICKYNLHTYMPNCTIYIHTLDWIMVMLFMRSSLSRLKQLQSFQPMQFV